MLGRIIEHEASIPLYLARVKQPFSKEIKAILEQQRSPLKDRLMVRERRDKMCFRFWQEGPGYDRNLYTPRAIERAWTTSMTIL